VFGDEFAAIEAKQWERAMSEGLPTFEETITAGPNETRTVANRFTIVGDSARERRIGVIRDVTEREEYRRKLEESNKRLEQFAYAASHDLQEPLRMVASYLQLLERRYGDELDEDGEEFIEFAVDGAERMSGMIDGLLEYARVETQGDPLKPVELNEVLDDVLTDLQLQIEDADAQIEVGSLPQVNGDEGQLRRVFQNLVTNAIEYSGENAPQIAVSAKRNGSMWRISVRDEGIGIDSDETDRVFEVFQRLHSRHECEGTGIGLALCERIVERHGGEIWVESEPGEGSTFSFTLSQVSCHT
jgi:light-regulated signal transduction histidine kinase (bacteriophytochrome)